MFYVLPAIKFDFSFWKVIFVGLHVPINVTILEVLEFQVFVKGYISEQNKLISMICCIISNAVHFFHENYV